MTFYISERTWGLNIGTHCPSKNRQEPLFVPLVLSVRYATDGKHQETTLESGCILCKTGALYQSSCPLPDQKQLIGTMCRLAVSLLYTQEILFTSRFSASLWFFPVYPRLLDTNISVGNFTSQSTSCIIGHENVEILPSHVYTVAELTELNTD